MVSSIFNKLQWCILHIATCSRLAALPAIKESFLRSERVGKDKRS